MSFVNKLFGGDKDATEGLRNFTPTGLNAGGLTSSFSGSTVSVAPTAARTTAVGDVASTFGSQADALGGLRPSVAPGISDLRRARLSEIDTARSSAIGNLRDNLARRRVLGSSFGADAVSRAEAEFAQQRDRVQAETFLQELEMTTNLINQEFTARRGQFQTGLDELNLEANLAAGLAGKATDVLAKNAQIEAALIQENNKLAADQAAGLGKFLGNFFPTGSAKKTA